MTTIEIPKHETGQIRVFAVNRPMADVTEAIESIGKPAVIADLLGRPIAENGAELFAVSDLTGVGLPNYLLEGYTALSDQITRDQKKLEALDGYVLLLFSSAFGGEAAKLSVGPDLTLIGTYGEEQPDMDVEPLTSEAAQPYSGSPVQTPPTPPRGKPGGVLMVLAIIVILAILLWSLF